MTTAGWLKRILEKVPDGMEIVIEIDKELIPLCKKVDMTMRVYETEDEPGVNKGETVLTFRPCNHSKEEEATFPQINLN